MFIPGFPLDSYFDLSFSYASILPADLVALRDPVHGDLLLDIPTILAHVASIHGNVTAEDLLVWKAFWCGRLLPS